VLEIGKTGVISEWYRIDLVVLWVAAALSPLTPNDPYSGRTAPLTSKRCILYIYSTNIYWY